MVDVTANAIMSQRYAAACAAAPSSSNATPEMIAANPGVSAPTVIDDTVRASGPVATSGSRIAAALTANTTCKVQANPIASAKRPQMIGPSAAPIPSKVHCQPP